MKTLSLTNAEFEAVEWAVGNFAAGDWRDSQSRARFKGMLSAFQKISSARNSSKKTTHEKETR